MRSVVAVCFTLLLGLLTGVAVIDCAGGPVQRAMRAADTVGLAANHAEPLWIAAYRRDGEAAADRACPFERAADPQCSRVRLTAVADATYRWRRVRDQWELARAAHDALAGCLESMNRADGGVCPDQDARAQALTVALLAWRCEVRWLGHPELDPIGGTPSCPADRDGGAL